MRQRKAADGLHRKGGQGSGAPDTNAPEGPGPQQGSVQPPDVGPLPGFARRGLWEFLKGHFIWLTVMMMCVNVWVKWSLSLLIGYYKKGNKLFDVRERSYVGFPDPFPGLIHEYIDVSGARLHVVKAGGKRPGKRLMLFVHGFPEGWFSWKHQLQEFKDNYDVVAFDLRGYGKSSKPEGRDMYRMEILVADVVRLVYALGYKKCILVGHDWGAMISWFTAALHPQMVEALVIICQPHPVAWLRNFDDDQRTRGWYMFLFQAPALAEVMMKVVDYQIPADWLAAHLTVEEVEAYKAHISQPRTLTAAISYYPALFDQLTGRRPSPQFLEARRRLEGSQLPMPVLMLLGQHDVALGPQLVRGTEGLVHRLELHQMEGGHFLHLALPKEVNDRMRAFLQKYRLWG
eukprot:jgi/Botrbrau1/17134/Bobra.0157s0031.1